jgi:hypothetical protein
MNRIHNVRESSPRVDYIDEIERYGFSVIQDAIDVEAIDALLEEIENANVDEFARCRAGKVLGIRNLLNALPSARGLANSGFMRYLVESVLGNDAKVVRGIYFDKHKEANWKVAWHQDLTIALRQQLNVTGYGPWSIKAGIPHVQPPASVLQNMLTLRSIRSPNRVRSLAACGERNCVSLGYRNRRIQVEEKGTVLPRLVDRAGFQG